MMKLALGTAQFGFDYGISNSHGQTQRAEVKKILSLAQQYHINTLDTASGYGQSEQVIGDYNRGNKTENKIITKLSLQACLITSVQAALASSLKRLNVESVYGLMIHDSDKLLHCSAHVITDLNKQLLEIKNRGLCQKVGVSVYSPEQLEALLGLIPIDIVQIPLNIFDQRFRQTQLLTELTKQHIEIHARSVFLQGLLLMNEQNRPDYFTPYHAEFEHFKQFCQQHSLTNIAACLAFAKAQTHIDKFVIGVSSSAELTQIVSLYKKVPTIAAKQFVTLASNKLALINPALWLTDH